MKICICICGLHRSVPLVINTLNKLFSVHDLEYILSVSYSFDNNYINTKELSEKEKLRDLELMIEAFIEEERYEDCAFLTKIKNKIEKHYAEKITKDLLKNLKK